MISEGAVCEWSLKEGLVGKGRELSPKGPTLKPRVLYFLSLKWLSESLSLVVHFAIRGLWWLIMVKCHCSVFWALQKVLSASNFWLKKLWSLEKIVLQALWILLSFPQTSNREKGRQRLEGLDLFRANAGSWSSDWG